MRHIVHYYLRPKGFTNKTTDIAKQYFREHNNGKGYPLRDIPRDLKLAAQHRALDEGLTLRELIFKALEEYLQRQRQKGD